MRRIGDRRIVAQRHHHDIRTQCRRLVGVEQYLLQEGYLYFTVSYPTSDGNVLKAYYMLTTMPGWALGFGYALERLGRARRIAVALLALSALAELPFLIYR